MSVVTFCNHHLARLLVSCMFKYEIYFTRLRPTADKNSTNSKTFTSNTPENTAKDVTLPKLQETNKECHSQQQK